ncbi:NAD(P)-binding protein [Hymenopellis radicata]|nr:NAD(P)-binding protein [Hymenopellis radicata]
MSLPTTTKEYYFPERGSFTNLRLKESSIPLSRQMRSWSKRTPFLCRHRALTYHIWTSRRRRQRNFYCFGPSDPEIEVFRIPDNLVPCSDMAGEILAVGDVVYKVEKSAIASAPTLHLTMFMGIYGSWRPTQGVLTQYRAFPAHSLVAIPEHLSYEEASTLPCAALTAYNALMGPVQLKAGDNVLILGTGGVSIFGLQFAVASGATVIVTSSSDAKLEIAKKLGATHLINYSKTPAWDEEVLRLTGGRGANHVLEVGGPGTLEKSLSAVAFNGWVNLIGVLDKSDTALASFRTHCFQIFEFARYPCGLSHAVPRYAQVNVSESRDDAASYRQGL